MKKRMITRSDGKMPMNRRCSTISGPTESLSAYRCNTNSIHSIERNIETGP